MEILKVILSLLVIFGFLGLFYFGIYKLSNAILKKRLPLLSNEVLLKKYKQTTKKKLILYAVLLAGLPFYLQQRSIHNMIEAELITRNVDFDLIP